MPLDRTGPDDLSRLFTAYRDVLRSHREVINRLNVYPVPDGDTGTNMALTLDSVVNELANASGMDETCKAIGHGSLMGARGNSGIILSQVLRGISDRFKPLADAGASDWAGALTQAAEAAYGAVMRPVEGTILTVVREAAEAAAQSAEGGRAGLAEVVQSARDAAQKSLDRTPELLPVLAQAGVVDAGGAGFLLLMDALLHVIDGRALPEPPDATSLPAGSVTATPSDGHDSLNAAHDSVSDLRYEVMFLLDAPDHAVPAFKEVWAGVGDSIVVVGGDRLWNCHIHTDDIGAAIEAALEIGTPRRIQVTDLMEQVAEEKWVRDAVAARGTPTDEEDVGPAVPTAAVAVATGDGIRRIFRSLGVHQLIAGGQSMNPSTAQVLEAVEAAPAEEIVILPNNKNIVPVAQAVRELTDKTVRVVPTTSVAEGFASLLAYDPEATADENHTAMLEAAARVIPGEVTQAVRSSDSPAGPIEAGDWLGISRDGISAVESSATDAVCALLGKLVTDDHEIVTLIEGEGARPAHTRTITEWLAEHRPNVVAEVHHGGQPLYPYLLSIE
ncbi:MAG TPA: DAK2 domain-containing protein [Acidimicrobiales bacterium]|nr:DAK2 domain-containing protein [Acidimicrobiales bacterium]